MNQKDNTTLVDNHGSGMCRVGFNGYDAPRAVFSSLVRRPLMRCIMAGMDQQEQFMAPCTKLREIPKLQFLMVVVIPVITQRQLDTVIDIPVVQVVHLLVQKTVAFYSCSSCFVVHMPVVVHDKFCWCRSCRSSLVADAMFAEVADAPVMWFCSSSVAAVEVTAAIPQLQLVVRVRTTSFTTPVVCNVICLVVQSSVNCDGCAVAVL